MIDFHVHVYPPQIVHDSELIAKHEPYFDALIHNKVHKWGSIETLLLSMTQNGINHAVIFGFAFRDIELCRICNNYIINAVKTYPEKFSGLCVVPPDSKKSADEILRCSDEGLIGVGELFPGGQGFDITDENVTKNFAGVLLESDMFTLIHTAEPVGHDYAGKGHVGPKEAAMFCANNPGVKTIFAHLGGGLWLYELMPEMKRILSNAYYDLAALPWLYSHKILDAVKAAGVLDKILFGTDSPILDASRYIKLFNESGLSMADIKTVTTQNAMKFL